MDNEDWYNQFVGADVFCTHGSFLAFDESVRASCGNLEVSSPRSDDAAATGEA